jgi:kynureninase
MDMKPVKSSNIAAVGYDDGSQTMHVEFANGNTYKYLGVEPGAHEAFVNADSVGNHFFRQIRNSYKSEKV